MGFNKKIILRLSLSVILGGILGYSYYYFIGCNGSCPIQSNPFASIAYGAVAGAIIAFPSSKKN